MKKQFFAELFVLDHGASMWNQLNLSGFSWKDLCRTNSSLSSQIFHLSLSNSLSGETFPARSFRQGAFNYYVIKKCPKFSLPSFRVRICLILVAPLPHPQTSKTLHHPSTHHPALTKAVTCVFL